MFPDPAVRELRSYITAIPAIRRADRITPRILMYMKSGIMYILIPQAGIVFNSATPADVAMDEGMANITEVTGMDIHSA